MNLKFDTTKSDLTQGRAVDPRTPEHSGLKSQPQNGSGVGFCAGIESQVWGLSLRMRWEDNFVLTYLFLTTIIRPIIGAVSTDKPMNI